MARRRTVDLLPEIFRTETNRQFLSATLDQLAQEPNLKRTQGYVGRRVGPGVNPADNYVAESTAARADYQLEPGVVFFRPETTTATDAITYPGMIDALALQGANTDRQDRLFQSQYYSWDPFCDLDKFTNYSQYYWLPEGPDSVDVSSAFYPTTDSWEVTRSGGAYQFSDEAGNNPVITLVRGGNYTFDVSQTGNPFWIQAAPGIAGTMPGTPNISSRNVLGVINNGEDLGTVTFNVPLKTAQNFFYGLTDIGTVDLITDIKFNEINNIYVSEFLQRYPDGIDGITNLNNRTVVFTNRIENAQDGGWQITTQFDPLLREQPPEIITNGLPGSFDTTLFDQTTDIATQAQRYSIWQIQYILDNDGQPFMRLGSIRPVPNLNKFSIAFGTEFSSTQWYKNAEGFFERIPLLTAVLDTLYYQDGTDPTIFGRIQLVDQSENNPINIDDIIGAKNYISPNGVVFTNGLKVQFRGLTEPARYQDLEYYVEGVGTGPGIDSRVGFIDGEAYFGAYHTVGTQKVTGATQSTEFFQQYIYDTVEESLLNIGAGTPAGAPLPPDGILNATVGNGIKLLPVSSFVTPETYTRSLSTPYDSTPYDATPYDDTLNAPIIPDYITINRASRDLNPWTRSNRWFHRDVIQATADYNNQIPIFDNDARGKRPIIEFRNNLKLFNFGTQAKIPVNIVDFQETDALSNINGQLGYGVDGYNFIDGSLVIFAADIDPDVRNRIYRVEFIDPDGTDASPRIINLETVFQGEALVNQTVVSLSGTTQQGLSYWFDGSNWIPTQQKTGVNQAPLFDVYDITGHSLSDQTVYPSSTFAGSRLFGYAVGGTQRSDEVLGFALQFLNINNVGDIVFENYFYTDTFLYVRNSVSQTEPISIGFVRQYVDRTSFSDLIGWQRAAAENRSRQVFRFIYDDTPLVLDIPVDETAVYAPLQVFQGTTFLDPDQYTYVISDNATVITITDPPETGTIIEVQVISNETSGVGFYQVPLNLENNPLNENSERFTLGTIRTHYQSIGQNLRDIRGDIDGPNNSRDLGNILPYGDNIVQHSSPLALSGVFLRRQQYEVISAIEFNSREYQKYKALLIDLAGKGDFVNNTPTQVLDTVMTEIALTRSDVSPFYWSDMVPFGQNYTETVYTFSAISTSTFDTRQTYDYTQSNFQGLNVYLNGRILTRGYDYETGIDSPTVTITVPLTVGDVISIREFAVTYGNFVPNTPTKMGLYGAYRPQKFLDETYVTPTEVIQGHDGSITVAFGDYRDDVLLEFETRIFNNIKITSSIPLTQDEIIPGQWRQTDYTLQEITNILAPDFLSWVGWNKLDYTAQTYVSDNGFTWNYSQSANKIDQQPLLGAWRGIYNYYYDTTTPNTTPWEMLGFSEKPNWWEDYYGPAPYTSGNLVLWEDLANGLVRDPDGEYVIPLFRRPDLLQVIPSGSEGALLPPIDVATGNYDATSFRRSWVFGDDGPVENVWRTSSAWPFAVMRLLALTKPAKFFSLFADRDRYVFDPNLDQYLWDGRYRLDAKQLTPLYGEAIDGQATSKASYINWIIDYNRQRGTNSTVSLTETLNNIGVRLCWRVGGFTDKRYLKLFTERSTPNSLNTSLLLPDESYQILLYKNQPFRQSVFSSVVVQSTDTGWQVYGYSTTRPYFNVLASRPNGNFTVITAGGQTVRVALDHSDDVVQVPYGYTFTSLTAVCDFLYSYGLLLEQQGFVFDTRENGYIMNWLQMAQEFLYWANQGWAPGSIINLNPGATRVSISQPFSVVDSLAELRPENLILNQNRQPLPSGNLVIERLENKFQVTSLTSDTINFLNLNFTAFEHLVIIDNVTVFADLIYEPVTGARQSRILVSGAISGDWNGTVDAPGFVLNEDNIQEWRPNQQYSKGEIVLFKNEYWSASEIIQPSQEFDYTLWVKSDYDQIQTGLLPNAANASDQLASAYSIYDAALDQEVDLFSFGLIGFRPREYMQALNLDDVSQVGLYQQFLGSKGTLRSAEIFSLADLGKEIAQYDIDEYWAIQRSQYGATANRNYIELQLNAALLKSDPSLVQVVQPQQVSQADQAILLQNIWKSSAPLNSTDIFPTTLVAARDASLPSAGYVNLEDVNFTTFDLDTLTDILSRIGSIEQLAVGSTIWVAKSNAYDWNVYRAERVPGNIITVSDNLDGLALVEFNRQHGLNTGNQLVIRFFDEEIDGAYRVRGVPSLTSLLIDYQFVGAQTTATGQGLGFTLQTARVAQASDIVGLSYSKLLVPGSLTWVDDIGIGRWAVIEKTNPFTPADQVDPELPVENSRFGASLTQGFQNLAAMVGAPGYAGDDSALSGAKGAVYTYVKIDTGRYAQNIILLLETEEAQGFGNAMDMGDQTWAVIGASASWSGRGYAVIIFNPPTSNAFTQHQILLRDTDVQAGDEFGYSVTISQNERWLYVGAPGNNRVFAYGRVDVQEQSVRYVTDGETGAFNYNNSITVADGSQLVVVLNNVVQILNTDFTIESGNVVFPAPPLTGLPLIITRRTTLTPVGDGIEDTYDLSELYSADNIYSFAVYLDNVIQRPYQDYTFDSNTKELVFADPPANTSQISIRATTWWRPVAALTDAGVVNGARFGNSVSTTTDGRQVLIGAPFQGQADTVSVAAGSFSIGLDYQIETVGTTDFTLIGAASNTVGLVFTATGTGTGNGTAVRYQRQGCTYVFDRSVERFQITNASQTTYTTVESLTNPGAPINVKLNGSFLTNSTGNPSGGFSITGANTVDISVDLAVGDILEIETNQFTLLQVIEDSAPFESARYGTVVDQCINDCSLYVAAPYDGSVLPEAGHVQFLQNQSRVYGTTTSRRANATLTPGEYLRVNNTYLAVSTPATWSSLSAYAAGTFVLDGTDLFRAVIAVPVGTAITDLDHWLPTNWAAVLSQDINDSGIPNVSASLTDSDVEFEGDGDTTEFSVGTAYSAADSYTTLVYVDNVIQASPGDYVYDNNDETVTFSTAPNRGSTVRVIASRLIISVINDAAAIPLSKLAVLPASDAGGIALFDDLDFETYASQQIIQSPVPQAYAHFGAAVFISDSVVDLVVGAPQATAFNPTTFDNGTTIFDAASTNFLDPVSESGAVYTFELLPAANASVTNPAQWIFGQQLYDPLVGPLDQFGTAVDYTTGVLLVGAPGEDAGDSNANYGTIIEFNNPDRQPAWSIKRLQQPVVDIDLMNTVFMYDLNTSGTKQYFDFFDPLQGKILGAVRQNLDYIGAVDPAAYNVGALNNYGNRWGQDRVGQVWWDTNRARFIDPNQDDITYASRRWGQLFPGSSVEIYQWVSSSVPPAQYTGPGIPKYTDSYVITSNINEQGVFGTTYFFWVSGIRTVDRTARKTLSIDTLARYIENPRSSGIAYIAPMNSSTVAIYNGLEYISAQDTVIHVEYDQTPNDAVVHVEYQLVAQDRGDSFLTDGLYRKLQDSFCGVDLVGNPVPDPRLAPSELYGVQFRPRQSMFANRFLALENYLVEVNRVMAQYPLAESRKFPLLLSEDPEPTPGSGAWNKRVADLAELSYQDLQAVPVGYLYLVGNDSDNNGLWTIYEVQSGTVPGSRVLGLIRVQSYDTKLYWKYINWYQADYNPLTVITAEVENFADLATLTLPAGSTVKVLDNAAGKFEIYRLDADNWVRVALQDGTMEILPQIWDYSLGRFGFDVEVFDAQYFDQEPVTETRRIIQSINQEIFIDDLEIERNRLLILMFNFILNEQIAPIWLTKTSLIDVNHTVRRLEPFQIYRQDNQDFVLNYIQEVKPYHTQIREFNLIYSGDDVWDGTVTDFDVPAYYNTTERMFVSPVLDDTGTLSTTSSTPSTSAIWQTLPWSQWYQNYLLSIASVTVIDGGSGYTVPPEVIVTGEAERPAIMQARINTAGAVVGIDVIDPGLGYLTTALISFDGGNGTGARAVAVMQNQLVRDFAVTIRYDRYEYQSTIREWQPNENYDNGTQVRYLDRVWAASSDDSTGVQSATFDPDQWTLVNAATLSGADRTMGFYAPGPNEPGLDLAQLISGVDYPGVQVSAPTFSQNTGFDVGNFDINPFDNISIGPEGRPTYDPAILDAIYESEFTDPYLGTLPAPAYAGDPPNGGPNPIVVSGGAFVDTYSSHAPEELVPGAIFDTLDFRVFTTPGSDWTQDGHGYDQVDIIYTYDTENNTYSWADLVDYPVVIGVWNGTQGLQLDLGADYTVDWVAQTVTVTSGALNGDLILIAAYNLGGGNQIFRNSYTGTDLSNNTLVIPVQDMLIEELVIFVNGSPVSGFSSAPYQTFETVITFSSSYGAADAITVIALGSVDDSLPYSWSTPVTQYAVATGSSLAFTLTNSLQGTNPANLIVCKNGTRARPAEGVEYLSDGSSLQYYLPNRGGYNQGLIADNEVSIYINNEPLILGVQFFVDPFVSGSDRTITLAELPPVGAVILISVNHAADYYVSGDTLIWRPTSGLLPIAGDIISITSFNDTSQQELLTQVFQGPTTTGIVVGQGYDTTVYDEGNISGDPGSFDYSEGSAIQTNAFDTGRPIENPSRLTVTLDGRFQVEGEDFIVDGTAVVILGPIINAAQVVAITSVTQSILPGEIAFRIFQDMRGTQTTYRITAASTTALTQILRPQDDTIYVADASSLSEPNLEQGLFGLITINGERIAYRNRDTTNNTLSGLRRGTAGTGAAEHAAGTAVYDIGIGNLLPEAYQDRTVKEDFLADGSETTFIASGVPVSSLTLAQAQEAVQVFVGGILQLGGYTITANDPLTVVFDRAPTNGYQVTVLVQQGLSWYEPGIGTASNGIALQETDTAAARFIRGT
jgi:hypothetical protein